ncbi:MAG TPA: polyprenyl synthetase family protein, partial [Ardenticatenaceae bacterium]|nr:polyprenyl synthetase family protein [Ardenticatenaceae bacterium]
MTEKLQSVSHLQDERLDQALRAIVGASGKLIRPAVAVTVTKMYAADPTRSTALAASVEMLHTATLVHDDMIDGANQRRGNPTLHTILNPASAVLLGDFLFAQAAEWAAQTESVRILHIFAAALMDLVGGELRQMWAKRDLRRSEQNYYDRIYGKTAALFAAACEG